MVLMSVLMDMRCDRFSIRTLDLRLRYASCARRCNLLPAVHAGHLIDAMWETEIPGLLVSDDRSGNERMVRSAVIGVPSGVAHSD